MSVKGKALADAPDSEAVIGKARSLLQSGQLADAARICQKLLENEPKSGDALYILAVANRLQKKFNDALSVNREMIVLDPSNGRAHQEMGHCLRDMGDSRSALAAYQEAVAAIMPLPEAGRCWNACTRPPAIWQLQILLPRRSNI